MTNQRSPIDYEYLDDVQRLTTPAEFKAVGDETRQKILGILGERAASTTQLAEILGQPKGTVAHHLRVLARARLVRVVRTRQVRAITEKYYGRVAREWSASGAGSEHDISAAMLRQVLAERASEPEDSSFVLVHARIPCSSAQVFLQRLQALAQEFAAESVPGERVYGLLGGVYLTDWPDLSTPASTTEDE